MRKILTTLLALTLCLSLFACSSDNSPENTADPVATEPSLSKEQTLIIDTVNEKINSEEFASWENLYKEFTGTALTVKPQVAKVTRYQIEDFDGAKMDCFLVAVAANTAHWVNEAEQQGALDGQLIIFVDANTATTYDHITTDALGVQHDTATEQGRATYLMWLHAGILDGSYSGFYLNETETVTEMTAEEISAINAALVKE